MDIHVHIEKRHLYLFVGVIGILIGVLIVIAYNPSGSGGNPVNFGHSVDEMDWNQEIQNNIRIRDNATIGGRIGIGTNNPKAKLQVNGEIMFGTQNNISLTIIEGNNPTCPAGKAIIAIRLKENTCSSACGSCTNSIIWAHEFSAPLPCRYGTCSGASQCEQNDWSHVLCG